MRTGWSKKFTNHKAYLGKDLGFTDEKSHFPGFGAEAV